MTATAATPRAYDPIDLSSRAFWSTSAQEREEAFAELRAERPVSWHPPVEDAVMNDPDDPGYWAITRRDDIADVSRNNEVFLSGKGVMFENFPVELLEASQSFLAMDPPRQAFLRKLVERRIHPAAGEAHRGFDQDKRQNDRRGAQSRGQRRRFCRPTAPRSCPFARCRTWSASPSRSGNSLAHAADAMVSSGDPEYLNGRHPLEVLFEAQTYVHQVAGMLAAERREHPGDDLFSSLVNAEVDGDRLTDSDIAAFFVLLTVAGNDTTRQTISHGLKALTDFPDQRAWLRGRFRQPYRRSGRGVHPLGHPGDDLPPHGRKGFRAQRPNHPCRGEGGDVLFLRQLGHRGLRASRSAWTWAASPNPHLGFGGGGVHFCLGAHVGQSATARDLRRALASAAGHPRGRTRIRGRQFHPRHPQHALHVLIG